MLSVFSQKLHEIVAAERDRWVLWAPVGLAIGIGFYFSLLEEPAIWSGLAALTSIIGLFWLLHVTDGTQNRQGIAFVIVIIGLAALGFTVAQIRALSLEAPVLTKTISSTTLSGRVVQLEHFSSGARITLENPRISKIASHQSPKKIRLRLRGQQPQIEPGDWISARARISPPGEPAVPGGFDFQRHSYFQEIGGYGFAFGPVTVTAQARDTQRFSLRLWVSRVRDHLTTRIINGLAAPYGGVAAALMTGEKHAISKPIVESMRNSGLAHILAISGLHIGLVAGIVFTGFRFLLVLIPGLALHRPIKKWAAVAAIIAAFLYAMLAGATLPTQRAFLMASIALIAVILDRRGISLRSVAWAAVIVLLFQPESLLGPSFQMSFAAVVALVAFYEIWSERRRHKLDTTSNLYNSGPAAKVGKYLVGVGMTTLVASAATAPFALYHFNQFADFGLIANLLAIPITALWVMPWAVISICMMPLGLEGWTLQVMGWGLQAVVYIAETVAGWPGSVTRLPAIPTWGIVVVAISGVWLCIWQQKWRILAVPCLLAGVGSFAFSQTPDLIVDGKARLFAVKSEDGKLLFSNLKRAAHERDIWLRHLGIHNASVIHSKQRKGEGGQSVQCDTSGCLFTKGQRTIAIALSENALLEDCWSAEIVVSLVPVRKPCPAKTVIDRFDLWRNGTYAITITKSRVVITSTNEDRGNRPWVLKRRKARSQAIAAPET